MIEALVQHIATVAADDSLRVVVLCGAGRHFMAAATSARSPKRLAKRPPFAAKDSPA
jgi:enoyl-CoA hydratase/carnithine racemase